MDIICGNSFHEINFELIMRRKGFDFVQYLIVCTKVVSEFWRNSSGPQMFSHYQGHLVPKFYSSLITSIAGQGH